jgi:hypothetical protein
MIPNIVYSTIGLYTFLNLPPVNEILPTIISNTISSLTSSIALMSYNKNNNTLLNYLEELEILDIELKLRVVDRWLKNITTITPNSSLDILYKSMTDICNMIANYINIIYKKINYHKSLWFNNWRNIDLDREMKQLKKVTKIFSERIILINIVSNNCDTIEPGEVHYNEFTVL